MLTSGQKVSYGKGNYGPSSKGLPLTNINRDVELEANPQDCIYHLSVSPKTHFEKSITIHREAKAENDLALAYSGIGRLHKQRGNVEQAREYLTQALEIFERLGTLIEPDKVRQELAELA